MANFCKNCGAKLSPEQLFCAECGTKIASAASEAAAASEQPVQQEQPVQAELSAAKPEKPQKKQAEKTKEASGGVPAVPVGAAISPGAVLAAALLCVECLPYLLKSLMFLAKKGSLSIFAVQFCGVLGYIAAFAAVILGAKLITGKWRFSYALFFTALLASVRAADKLFLPNASFRHDLFGIFCLASDALARFLCAVFLVSVLRKLFSDKNRAQGGVIGAFILCSLSLLSTEFTNIIWRILPLDIASPMGTFAYKISAGFISAGFLALAAKRLLKKQKEKKPKDISSGLTVSGLLAVVLLAFSAFVMKTDIIKQSAYECAANDVERCIARAEGVETIGDMDAALASYKEAGEHLAAWKTVAEGEVYNVPSQYCNDDILQYLSYINR
ncbi:MAG: zinc ribbon domain-containing protein, partial [Firmicutes bacterium]|nr:zinc ribbon domain-containing protein [Bacillota bacterium]